MKRLLLVSAFSMLLICTGLCFSTSSLSVYGQTIGEFETAIMQLQRYSGNPIIHRSQAWCAYQVQDPVILEDPSDPNKLIMYFGGWNAGMSLEGIGRATTTKTSPYNWVLDPSNPLISGARLGSIVKLPFGGYYMFVSVDGSSPRYTISLYTSTNVLGPWSNQGMVLTVSSDETSVENPLVIYEGGQFKMIYALRSNTLGVLPEYRGATSTDGRVWSKIGLVFPRGTSGSWDDKYMEWHTTFQLDSKYYLFYEACNTALRWSAGCASSSNFLGPYTRFSGPVLSGAGSGWDALHIATPACYLWNEMIYLYYQAGNRDPYMSNNWEIGVATAALGGSQLGTLRVFASYNGTYVATSVTATGPQTMTGITTTDPNNPLTFSSLTAGAYVVTGTYFSSQSESVVIRQGQTSNVTLNFGGALPSTPQLPLQLIFVLAATASVVGLVLFARQRRTRHFSIRRGKHRR